MKTKFSSKTKKTTFIGLNIGDLFCYQQCSTVFLKIGLGSRPLNIINVFNGCILTSEEGDTVQKLKGTLKVRPA